MDEAEHRAVLDRLIRERGDSYDALSKLLGRNPAYIQQYVKRGSPRRLGERDRRTLARYFGIDERMLGAPELEDGPAATPAGQRGGRGGLVPVPRLKLGASAGPGSLDQDERAAGTVGFDGRWLRDLGVRPDRVSIIRVKGESMLPALADGDDIMVDRDDAADRLREGIYVLRYDGALIVKRLVPDPKKDRLSIVSDNPDHRSFAGVDSAEVEIVGRVVWAGRRLG